MQDKKDITPDRNKIKTSITSASNLGQMTKSFHKKSDSKTTAQKPNETGPSNSLIGESGCSGYFGAHNRSNNVAKEISAVIIPNPAQEDSPELIFYPQKNLDDEIDFDSLDFQEAREEFKMKKYQENQTLKDKQR